MNEIQKQFGKYTVSLQINMDGDGATGCWIEYKTRTNHYSSSLAAAMDLGYIEDTDDGSTLEIDEAMLDKIESWALANGY